MIAVSLQRCQLCCKVVFDNCWCTQVTNIVLYNKFTVAEISLSKMQPLHTVAF